MDELSYNGKNFSEFNTFFDGSKAFGSPEKDYELVEIMGRNGSLSIYNDRFKDILLPFPCFVRSAFLTHYRQLVEFLNSQHGYLRLETSKEPNHFRKALFQGIVEPQTTPFNHGGQFTINFLAKPQRFLKSGETPVSSQSQDEEYTGNPSVINNPSGLSNVKSLEVGLSPIQNLNGYDSPWIGGAGKNLLQVTATTQTKNHVTFTINADGSVKITGTATADTALTLNNFTLRANVAYTLTGCPNGGSTSTYLLSFSGVGYDSGNGYSVTRTSDTTADVNITIFNGTAMNHTFYPMIRTSGDATFAPYSNICPITGHTSATVTRTVDGSATDYTIDLNGTIYGGTVDVVSGLLTVTHGITDMGTFTWSKSSVVTNGFVATSDLPSDMKLPTSNAIPYDILSDRYKVISCDQWTTGNYNGTIANRNYSWGKGINVRDDTLSALYDNFDADAVKAAMTGSQLVYPITTPITYQLTPTQVSLLTGVNVISTDGNGDMTVTVTEPSLLVNPTLFESKPLLRIYGTGTVNINNQYITISAHSFPYIDIDCELMDAFYGSSNANQYVTFSDNDYITLKSGNNYIAYGNQIEVTPRWYEI